MPIVNPYVHVKTQTCKECINKGCAEHGKDVKPCGYCYGYMIKTEKSH
jgi:hypothetical protein